MTDHTFAQLEDVVERSLKPVRASRSRKQMLGMELLAHVMDVFDVELAALGDEQAALNQTLHRFGRAEVVGNELQATLTFTDRWFPFLFEENPMKVWLWLVAVVAVFVGMGFVMPAVAALRETGVAVHLVPYTLGALMAVAGVAFIGRAIHRKAFVS